jgi:putative transposase
MAQDAVRNRNVSVRFSCQLFVVSESCYRYQPHLNEENDLIAEWLLRITDSQRSWGFGLVFYTCVMSKDYREPAFS